MSFLSDTGHSSFICLLNSKFAQRRTNFISTFNLQIPIQVKQNVNILIRLRYVEIPNMFKNISSSNNTLNYQVGATNYSMTITPSQYDAYTLRTYLNANLQGGITVSYLQTTNQYLFSGSGSFSLLESTTCAEQLGFRTDTRYNSDVSNQILSDGFVNLSGINAIYLYTNLATDNRIQNGRLAGMLDYVPVDVPFGNMVLFNNQNETHWSSVAQKYINSIDIVFQDGDGNVLDASDINFTLILEFSTRLTQEIVQPPVKFTNDNSESESSFI